MENTETLKHTRWDCKYHVVFIPKYYRKALYKELRQHLAEGLRDWASQKESGEVFVDTARLDTRLGEHIAL